MKDFFINWGNLMQVIVAIIFGIISIILWYQDFKKTAMIKELQTQTYYLTNLVKMVMDLSRPSLLVRIVKDREIEIENIGDDINDLYMYEFTEQKNYTIKSKINSKISRNSIFRLRFEKVDVSSPVFDDELYFTYFDRLGKKYKQKLKFINDKNVIFEPHTIEN